MTNYIVDTDLYRDLLTLFSKSLKGGKMLLKIPP